MGRGGSLDYLKMVLTGSDGFLLSDGDLVLVSLLLALKGRRCGKKAHCWRGFRSLRMCARCGRIKSLHY